MACVCVCITMGIVGPGVISERFIAPSSKGSMCPWLQVSVRVVNWKGMTMVYVLYNTLTVGDASLTHRVSV